MVPRARKTAGSRSPASQRASMAFWSPRRAQHGPSHSRPIGRDSRVRCRRRRLVGLIARRMRRFLCDPHRRYCGPCDRESIGKRRLRPHLQTFCMHRPSDHAPVSHHLKLLPGHSQPIGEALAAADTLSRNQVPARRVHDHSLQTFSPVRSGRLNGARRSAAPRVRPTRRNSASIFVGTEYGILSESRRCCGPLAG